MLEYIKVYKGIIIYYIIMKITKKIIRIGCSDGIIIDKPILKKMRIKTGDLIELNFRKVIK